jgi:hypothetical protein
MDYHLLQFLAARIGIRSEHVRKLCDRLNEISKGIVFGIRRIDTCGEIPGARGEPG